METNRETVVGCVALIATAGSGCAETAVCIKDVLNTMTAVNVMDISVFNVLIHSNSPAQAMDIPAKITDSPFLDISKTVL